MMALLHKVADLGFRGWSVLGLAALVAAALSVGLNASALTGSASGDLTIALGALVMVGIVSALLALVVVIVLGSTFGSF